MAARPVEEVGAVRLEVTGELRKLLGRELAPWQLRQVDRAGFVWVVVSEPQVAS